MEQSGMKQSVYYKNESRIQKIKITSSFTPRNDLRKSSLRMEQSGMKQSVY